MTTFLKKIRTAVEKVADSWWPIVVIALLTSFALYQHWQMTHPRGPQLVREGEQVQSIKLLTLQRDPVWINWKANRRGTVVYYTSPDCVWCQRNADAARAAYQRASALGYQFIGVSVKVDGLNEYLLKHAIPFPVYVDLDGTAAKTLKLAATPETIFISPSGIVQKAIIGAYRGKNAEVLGRILGLTLAEIPAV